jgi:outer membrane lipoprotein carrier protein
MKVLFSMLLIVISTVAFSDTSGPARSELERFSDGLETLQVDFSQVVKSQDGSIQDKTYGNAWLKSPDKLRWVYAGDFPEIIVADGTDVWIYDEALEQVTIKPQSTSVADTPLLILTDISQLDQQFMVAELGDFEDMQLLELKSRDEESQFERILMGVDASGIRMMIMEDAFGQRTEIHFTNIVRNAEVEADVFRFTPPEGTDVVGQASPTN